MSGSWPARVHDALEKVLPSPGDSEELGKLGHRDGERGARFESKQYRLADEAHETAQTQQEREDADRGENESGEGSDVRPSSRVTESDASDGRAHQHRDRRRRTNRELARAPEESVAEPAYEVTVHSVLRRKTCERGVGERDGNGVRGERNSSHRVLGQPFDFDIVGATAPEERPPAIPRGELLRLLMTVSLPRLARYLSSPFLGSTTPSIGYSAN